MRNKVLVQNKSFCGEFRQPHFVRAIFAGEFVHENDLVAVMLGIDVSQRAGGVWAGDAWRIRREDFPILQII